jgi:hypothetical protein
MDRYKLSPDPASMLFYERDWTGNNPFWNKLGSVLLEDGRIKPIDL